MKFQIDLEQLLSTDPYRHVANLHTRFICNWIDRMSRQWGGTVFDARDGEAGKSYDWGQAIACAQYGVGWGRHLIENHIDDCDEETVRIAKEWEAGEWPAWAWTLSRKQNLYESGDKNENH